MEIRKIDIGDTKDFWQLQKQLNSETKFMMLEPDEREFNFGKAVADVARTDFTVAAIDNGKFVGYLSADCGKYRRVSKTAYIIVGILKAYQHQGIGQKFFERLDVWAKEKQIKRLELTVLITNNAAIALYQKNGFEIEGVRKQSMCLDGEFIDEFYMGKVYK